MNRENILYRKYCKTCSDFTLHSRVFSDEINHEKYSFLSFNEEDFKEPVYICKCGCQYTQILLKDIDSEKIEAQRVRFENKRRADFHKNMSIYTNMLGSIMNDFNNDGFNSNTIIIESDAGLLKEKEIISLEKEEVKRKKKEELEKFSLLGRNEICLCGSNKKYKKCCLLLHETW